jgi:hypothetical protein
MMRIVVVGPKGRSIYCRTFGGRDITVIRNWKHLLTPSTSTCKL